jgi:DNA polymerase-3 subunit epsilon
VQRRIESHARQEARTELTLLIDAVHLADVVDEGAEEGDLAYLEVLAEVLQDGVLTAAEQATLADVAELYSLDECRIAGAHRAFVVAMARLALLDLRVTREERGEIMRIASVLAVDATDVSQVLNEAEIRRWTLLSAGLRPLPEDWAHGEPLRVGDKIAFTGCDEGLRESLEAHAQALGVRVINSVSARTALLVTDGTFRGTKADAAARFGTRTVLPAELAVLLNHLQPHTTTDAGNRREAVTLAEPQMQAISRPDSGAGSPAQIRAWAARAGYHVGARGRIPADIIQAYANAHEPAGQS